MTKSDTALARVVQVFGAAHPHHAYLIANQRANRMKVLVHDGVGVWLAARRLNTGKFMWGDARVSPRLGLSFTRTKAGTIRCSPNGQCLRKVVSSKV